MNSQFIHPIAQSHTYTPENSFIFWHIDSNSALYLNSFKYNRSKINSFKEYQRYNFILKTKVFRMVKTHILSFMSPPLFAHFKGDRGRIS